MADTPHDGESAATPARAVAAPRPPAGPVHLRPSHLYKAAGLLFLLALVYRFFQAISQTLLLAYAAAILAVALNALTSRLPLHRKWVAVLTGLVFLGGVALLLSLGAPALLEQIRGLAERAPEIQARLRGWSEWIRQQTGMQVPLSGKGAAGVQEVLPQVGGKQVLGGAAGALETVLLVLVLVFGGIYALASPNERLLNPLLRVVPRDLRPAVYRMLQLLGERLVGWLKGTGIAMLAVGTLSITAFYLIGIPNALALGLFNGLVEFIPIFGPWIGGGAAILVALMEDPTKAAWTAVAALAIQQIEANAITPWAMSQAAEMHPFVTLFALLLFGSLFGFLGIFLAVPLAILVWTVVQVLWVERAIDTDEDRIAPVVEE
jgi:predicted PurR-regulated permease PerM